MDSLKWIGFKIFTKMKKRMAKCYANKTLEKTTSVDEISALEPVEYDFITIQIATNNFSNANKIGEGGFGVIYKGIFEDGPKVVVKRLFKDLSECSLEFKNEVALIATLQHRNLVRLLGYCQEGKDMLLVYEFAPNGSLHNILFDPVKRRCLDWERRYKIIECIARGLIYLHEGSRLRIIHCNLKASNILLDEDFNPKITDFGMAKLFALDKTHGSASTIVGTSRYIAPEYVLQGEISVKTDVYSFGVLVLEIISGQKFVSFQESINNLLSYAWTHLKGGSASNVIDPMLGGISSPVHEITKCIHIALLCVQENVADRPKMVEALQMLNDLSISLPEPLAPGLFIHGSISSSEASSQFTKNPKSISDQYYRKMQKQKARSYAKTVEESSSSVQISPMESLLKYELITIQNGTNNFSEANKVGIGRFGPVYKGKLENGLEFAVTWLSKNTVKGDLEFKNEVKLIGRLQHKNLVRLHGYCQEGGEMILVYEFFSNGTLYEFLFDPVKCGYLNWGRRYKIIEGIAKGLVYLHEDSRLRIVHCDVKASNILLDADLNPKIADFGIALLFTLDKPHCGDHVSVVCSESSRSATVALVVLMMGNEDVQLPQPKIWTQLKVHKYSKYDSLDIKCRYVAPEYISTSELSVKSDVYSFGVLVLEIISGQKWFSLRNEESREHFSSYAWKQWTKGTSSNVIDPMLRGISSPVDDIIKCIQVALLCVQEKVEDRPTMGEVLQMLSNLSMSLPIPSIPLYFSDSNVSSDDLEASFNKW